MKNFLSLMTVIALFSFANAQTVIFEDDFESYEDFIIDNIGDWIMYDGDGDVTYSYTSDPIFPNQFDEKAFMVFNPSAAAGATNSDGSDGETRNFDPHSGDKYMAAWASVNVSNDDWMISPAFTLGSEDNEITFYVKSLSDTYGWEEYNFHVYVGSDVPEVTDFNWEGGDVANTWENWYEVVVNMDAYAGQTVRFAIQCISDDVYMFMVDDFKVTAGGMGTADLNRSSSTLYPNPVTDVFNIKVGSKFNAEKVNITISDLTGKEVRTFSKDGSFDLSDLPSGVYIVRISDGKFSEARKIIKK